MAEDFFPFIGNKEDYVTNLPLELPMYKELAIDFKTNNFIIDSVTNDIKIIEGNDAIKVWIYKAIMTERSEYLIYTDGYGTELSFLVGQKYSQGLTEMEAFRYIKEALLINPYITSVENKGVHFKDDTLFIKIKVETVYGEVDINVRK